MSRVEDHNHNCRRCYATLRIYPGDVTAAQVSELLGLEPHRSWVKDDSGKPGAKKQHGWFLSSKGHVDSTDSREHIDWLLDSIAGRQQQMLQIQQHSHQTDIICFWHCSGNSGPMLSPAQMQKLATFNLPIGWNVYRE